MSNKVVSFPRRKPLEWDEMPAHWDLVARRTYDLHIEEGMGHDGAFAECDKYARAQEAVQPQPGESRLDFLARQARAALAAAAAT